MTEIAFNSHYNRKEEPFFYCKTFTASSNVVMKKPTYTLIFIARQFLTASIVPHGFPS